MGDHEQEGFKLYLEINTEPLGRGDLTKARTLCSVEEQLEPIVVRLAVGFMVSMIF
jgi:hypothetical protein